MDSRFKLLQRLRSQGGRDREFVYWVNEDDLPDDNGDAQSRGAPRQLQRTGCV